MNKGCHGWPARKEAVLHVLPVSAASQELIATATCMKTYVYGLGLLTWNLKITRFTMQEPISQMSTRLHTHVWWVMQLPLHFVAWENCGCNLFRWHQKILQQAKANWLACTIALLRYIAKWRVRRNGFSFTNAQHSTKTRNGVLHTSKKTLLASQN